jgi:SagB-type dehydrogenase family enzyme
MSAIATSASGTAAHRTVALPPPTCSPLVALIGARRSRREFARRRLAEADLGTLLWAGQGVTSPEGLRASPSAGARYPVTLTVVDEVGIWRYRPVEHALVLVIAGDGRVALSRSALDQEAVANAPVTIAVTADPALLAGRYGSRAERYCYLEAGHIAQNVLLQAVSLGLAAVPVAAFDDDAVLATIRVSPTHLAMYLIPVGWPATG